MISPQIILCARPSCSLDWCDKPFSLHFIWIPAFLPNMHTINIAHTFTVHNSLPLHLEFISVFVCSQLLWGWNNLKLLPYADKPDWNVTKNIVCNGLSIFCTVHRHFNFGPSDSQGVLSTLCQILTKTISNAVSYLATVGLWLASLFRVPLDTLLRGLQQLLFFQAKHCKPW